MTWSPRTDTAGDRLLPDQAVAPAVFGDHGESPDDPLIGRLPPDLGSPRGLCPPPAVPPLGEMGQRDTSLVVRFPIDGSCWSRSGARALPVGG